MTVRSPCTPAELLGAAGGDAEAADHLVQDSTAPLASARSRSSSRKPSAGGTRPMLAGSGSARIAASSCASSAARSASRRSREPRPCAAAALAGTPGLEGRRRSPAPSRPAPAARRRGRGRRPRTSAPARGRCGRAREAHRGHRRLRPRGGHAQHLHALHPPHDLAPPASTSPAVGAPKLVPRRPPAATAASTSGWAWPWISGPHEQT